MKTIFISALLILYGCGKHEGKYVKDKDGNVYQLEWKIGWLYQLHHVDTTQVKIKIK
jgi:hypothetical protein